MSTPDPNDEPIIVAEFSNPSEFNNGLPTAAKQNNSCLIAILIASGLFLLFSLVIGVALWKLLVPPDVIDLTHAENVTAIDQQYADARLAFSSDLAPEDDPDFAEISAFVKKVSRTVDGQSSAGISRLVDFDHYAKEMRRHKELGRFGYLGNQLVSSMAEERLIGPLPLTDFQIFKIEDLGNDERLVYLQTSNGYGSANSCLWWIAKHRRNWRLYNWHSLEYEMNDAKETAVLVGEPNPRKVLEYNRYYDLCHAYLSPDENLSGKDYQSFQSEIFLKMEALDLPDLLVASISFDIATRWWANNEPTEALRVLQTIPDLTRCPGTLRLRADIRASEGDYQLAAEDYLQFINRVGPDHGVLISLADCYKNLELEAEELAIQHQLSRFKLWTDTSNSFRIMELDDAPGLQQHFANLAKRPDSDAAFQRLISALGDNQFFVSELEQLDSFLTAHHAGSENELLAKCYLKLVSGKFEEGFRILNRVTENSAEPDWETFWSTAAAHDQIMTAFQLVSDKSTALASLWNIYEYGDYAIELEDLSQIIQHQLSMDPQHELANYAAGSLAFYDNDFKNTIKHCQIVSANPTDKYPDNDNYYQSDAKRLLAISHLRNDELDTAIKIAQTENSLDWLLENAVANNDEAALNELTRHLRPTDENYAYYRGLMFAQQRQWNKAKKNLGLHLNRQTDETDSYPYGNWTAITKLVDVCSRDGNPNEAFEIVPTEPVFSHVADQLLADRQWDQAEQLLKQGKKIGLATDNTELINRCNSLQRRLLWIQQNFAELVKSFESSRSRGNQSASEISCTELEYIVRAALRLGKPDVADDAADELADQHYDFEMKALVALHRRRLDDFLRIQQKIYDYNKDFYIGDPDTPQLSPSEKNQISGSRPRILNTYDWNESETLTWLSPSGSALETTAIQRAIQTTLGNNDAVTHSPASQPGTQTWICRSGPYTITVRESESNQVAPSTLVDPSLSKLVNRHRTSRIVSVGHRSNDISNRSLEFAVRISQSLIDEDCLVVGVENYWLPRNEAIFQFEKLLSGEIVKSTLISNMTPIYLVNDESTPTKPDDVQPLEVFRRSLYGAASHLLTKSKPNLNLRLTVGAAVDVNSATELVTVEVAKIQRSTYGGVTFVGTLVDNCEIDPSYRSGDLVELELYEISQWDLTGEGDPQHGQLAQ